MKSLLHIAAAALLASTVLAENWARFRGPNGQGISSETNLPVQWSTTENIAWKAAIPGDGWSSPIVWDDRIFMTSTLENGTKCHVICVDAKSGKILWDKEVFEQFVRRKEGKNSHSTPTATTDGEKVYATFGDGSVVALTFDGSIAWTNREVKFYSRHGLGSSPVLVDGLLVQCYDGSQPVEAAGNYPQVSDFERTGWQLPWDKSFLVGLDTKTGKRMWTGKRGMSRIAHVTPIVTKIDGRDQLISGAGDRMQGFDPKTGELIWSIYQQGEGVTPSPVLGNGMLFASSGFEKTTLRGIKLGGAKGDVTESHVVWEQKKGVPTQPSPLFVKPYLYTISDGGIASCYKPESGEIVWQERVGGNFSASPEAAETTVIAPGAEFKVLAKNKLEGKAQSSMAVSGGKLFIRSDKNLYCIGK